MEMKSIKEIFEKLFGLKEGDYFNIIGSNYAYNPYLVEKKCISDCDFDYIEDEAIKYALRHPSSVELTNNASVKISVNNMVYSIRQYDLHPILELIEEKCIKFEKAMTVSDIKMSAGKFIRLFKPDEWRYLKLEIRADNIVNQFYDSLLGLDFIDLSDPEIQADLTHIRDIGVLTDARLAEILAPVL